MSAAWVQWQVLRDEKRVMEIELEQRSAFLAELDKKNKLLLGAWLKHLNEEATKLNEANKIAEECDGGAGTRGHGTVPSVDAAGRGV